MLAAWGVVQNCRRQGHGFESIVQTMGCLLYKIHPSTYGMFQAAPGRMYVVCRAEFDFCTVSRTVYSDSTREAVHRLMECLQRLQCLHHLLV
jgi:hypothetical protein